MVWKMQKGSNSNHLWIGCLFILVGISIAGLLSPGLLGVNRLLVAIENESSGSALMIVALLVVTINTMMSLPYYLGAFIIGDSLGDRWGRPFLKIAVPVIVIPLVNFLIESMIALNYKVDATDVFLLFIIFVLTVMGKGKLSSAVKCFILSQILFGVNWLNEVPALSSYGFGRGAISSKITAYALAMGFDNVLTLYSLLICVIFILNGVIFSVYFTLHTEKLEMSRKLHNSQLEALESRSDREVLHLVHDLKTPLTTIQGLTSLIEIRNSESKINEYCQNLSQLVGSMSEMISEILDGNRKAWHPLHELFNYIRASRLSGTDLVVEVDLPTDNIDLWINKIRITRAMVNLIDNAFDAIQSKTGGHVTLLARVYPEEIWLGVSDNGVGIPHEDLEQVWQAGYSRKQHPGIGLPFVKQVAENHGGLVQIESDMGKGTTVWIQLPKETLRNEDSDHRR